MLKSMPENKAANNPPLISGRRNGGVTKLTPVPSTGYRRPLYTRRAQARIYRKNRIRFAEYNSEQFHNALMLNESAGGMYFETDIRLVPGVRIHINILPSPFIGIWSPDNLYTAEVRWCRPINADRQQRFGVGVRFCPPTTQ